MSDHDARLLRRFAKETDEAAFRELVARNFALVYSVALRQLNGDTHLAEDVAQMVFTDLARKARALPRRTVVTGWLYEAARRAAAKTVRGEQRRRLREQEASMMTDAESSPDWELVRPALDSAMGQLGEQDRCAVLLHYFELRGFRDIGAALGISDDAAQKRVTRALPKLRDILLRRGVSISSAALATALTASAVKAAPAGMAFSVSTASLATAATAPARLGTLLLAAVNTTRIKTMSATVAVVLFGSGIAILLQTARVTEYGKLVPLNLSKHYNGDLTKSWTPVADGNDLQDLPRGRQVFARVPFDIHGVVQLQGNLLKRRGFQLPERVEGIVVHSTATRIHLLHADSGCAPPPGTAVASLILNYADGQRRELSIRDGVHCLDWWAWNRTRPSDTNSIVAWTGRNAASRDQGIGVRLFQTTFLNPEPAKKIQTVDYVSTMTCAAPFMVALTVER